MTQMGRSDARQMLTVVRRLWGHDSTGPSGVCDQSIDLIRRPISPPPARKAKGSGRTGSRTVVFMSAVYVENMRAAEVLTRSKRVANIVIVHLPIQHTRNRVPKVTHTQSTTCITQMFGRRLLIVDLVTGPSTQTPEAARLPCCYLPQQSCDRFHPRMPHLQG